MNSSKKTDPVPKVRFSKDAELAVIGSVLLNNQAFATAGEMLRPDDFFLDAHRRIFSAMMLMDRDGTPIDLVTLMDELDKRGETAAVGGVDYISHLADGLPKSTNVAHYAKIVKENAGLRRLAFTSQAISEKAVSGSESLNTVIEEAEEQIAHIREGAETRDKSPVSLKEAINESYTAFERLAQGDAGIVGTTTGYSSLDQLTGGWMPEDFVVVGARPSMGKTALVMEFARRTAEAGEGVLVLSLEMRRSSLVQRMACTIGRVDSHKLRTGNCSTEDVRRLTAALAKMTNWPLWILDPSRMYSGEVIAKVRHYAERFKLRLVIVDYLQLLRAKAENRTQEITAVSRDLKEAAKALGKSSGGTLIATAQLGRIKGEPQLIDLRESGQIEQDADLVMMIWNKKTRKEVKTGQADPISKYIGVKKQRNGPTGALPFIYLSPYMGFEMAHPDEWDDEAEIPDRGKGEGE